MNDHWLLILNSWFGHELRRLILFFRGDHTKQINFDKHHRVLSMDAYGSILGRGLHVCARGISCAFL